MWFQRAQLSMGGTLSTKTRVLSSEEEGRLSERFASIVANNKLATITPRSKAGCALQPWVALSRVAEAGVGSMASKAGRLKQKALSVVDSVQTLGSHNNSNSCTITVKSSPQRTAAEMTKLSVRRGWMLKRNEQRAWQRRYCCLVPHTFMYYFESKDSEVPRGVIDMEAYTDIGVEESTGAIVLGPGPDAPPGFRKYYFRPEEGRHTRFRHSSRSSGGGEGSDGGAVIVRERGGCRRGAIGATSEDDVELPFGEDEDVLEGDGDGGGLLGEWLSGFHRDRFKVVRDERDAYMNLQEEYMTQMQDTTSAMSEAESERGRLLEGLRAEHAAARTAARDGLEQARALFREEELPQEEAASLPLPALLARVRAVTSERRSREAELEGQLAAAMAELREARGVEGQSRGLAERLRSEAEEATERARCAEARIRSAEEEAARERALRAAAESSLENCTQRLQAAVVDVEQGQVNLGIMAGERRAALAKVAELLEQKRLLVREIKASRRSLAEASAVNRSLARAYESLDRSLRSSSSNMMTNTDAPTEHTETARGGSSNSVGGGEAPAAPQPFSPSSSGSAHGGGTGDVGGVNGGGEKTGMIGARSGFPLPDKGETGENEVRGAKGPRRATVPSASAAARGVQVRNLSTGDVDVFDGARRARERASTDGGAAEDPRAVPPLSAWQPHPSNIGLKITQSFANASWPWALSKTSEGGGSFQDSKPSTAPGPPGGGGGIGVGSNGAEGMSASSTSVSSSSSAAAVAASALAGFSRGSGSLGGGGVRSRGGMTDIVPALHLDDDYDDDDVVHHVFSERASVVYVNGGGGTVTEDKEAVGAGTGLATAEGVGMGAGEKGKARAEEGGAEEGAGGRRRSSLGNGALRCNACGGTVEGPRHSTCHCEVPDISPDAETDRSQANREAQATPAVQAAPTVDPVSAAAGGLSKLKGVFKSFNGKVEVARQILDSAVRQNIADNIPRQQPPKPSTAARRSSWVSSTSMHGEIPAAATNYTGSLHGADMKPAGVRRDSIGEKEVRTTGMATDISGITEDGSSNYREKERKDSEDAVDELNIACADSTPETNAPSPPTPAESDSELEMEACSEADLAGVVGSDATGAVGTQDEVGSNETTAEDPPERPSRAVSIGGDDLSRTPTPPQDPLLSLPLLPSELPDPESCDDRSIERPGGSESKVNDAGATSLIEAGEVSPVQAPYPPESDLPTPAPASKLPGLAKEDCAEMAAPTDAAVHHGDVTVPSQDVTLSSSQTDLRTPAPASTLPGLAKEDCAEMEAPTDAAVHHGDVTVPSQDVTLSSSQAGAGSDPQCTLAPEGGARLGDDDNECGLDETVVGTRPYGEEEGSEGQGEVMEEKKKERDGEEDQN